MPPCMCFEQTLQKVHFHNNMRTPCCRKAYQLSPQELYYEASVLNITERADRILALQGNFRSVFVDRGTEEDVNKKLTLIWWPHPKDQWWGKALGVSHLFPEIPGYLKQMFVSPSGLFLLTKYSEDYNIYHHLLFLCFKDAPATLPSCNIKEITHSPKLFSWQKAQILCKDAFGILPQFESKNQQDSFLSLMKKSTEIFPVEAIFIGLRKRKMFPHEVRRTNLCATWLPAPVLLLFVLCCAHLC